MTATGAITKPKIVIWVQHLAHIEGNINTHSILMLKHERKERLGKRRRRWEDTVKIGRE
jgi:hypothetical protein